MIFSLLDGKEDYPSKVVKETLNEGNMITRQICKLQHTNRFDYTSLKK